MLKPNIDELKQNNSILQSKCEDYESKLISIQPDIPDEEIQDFAKAIQWIVLMQEKEEEMPIV
ncbi:hypothetical protein D3C76_1633390 [compost metagenome]